MNADGGQLSLMHGWVPLGVEVLAAMATGCVFAGTGGRWRTAWLAATVGLVTASIGRWALQNSGASGEVAPWSLYAWTGATGFGLTVALVGWRGAGGWWRNAAVLAASLCLLSTGLVINAWIGYLPSVAVAWDQLSGSPLPSQLDWSDAVAMRARGERPHGGRVIAVDTGSRASGFAHRTEWVYLPPAWFDGADTPLSAVMMVGGEFAGPADWVRAGRAVATADSYAETHDGRVPVMVFVDANGSFFNDTECVNGIRGRAADHLTKDVVPQVSNQFGVGAGPMHWSVAGFSSGGTCAVTLAVMHPELFGGFLDIAGDERPNTGTQSQTVHRLYGGDARAWSDFDPVTVMTRHGSYEDTTGLFVVPDSGRAATDAAARLCNVGVERSIRCSVREISGRHTWPFAAEAFETALPWLARIHSRAVLPRDSDSD